MAFAEPRLDARSSFSLASAGTAGSIARDSELRRALAAGDAVAVVVALSLALVISSPPESLGRDLVPGLVVAPLFVLVFKLYGLYDRDMKRISHTTVDDLPWLFHATLAGTLLLWLYSKCGPMDRLAFGAVVTFGASAIFLVALGRSIVRRVVGPALDAERALLIGDGRLAHALVTKLRAHGEYRVEVIGCLGAPGTDAIARLGTVDDLERVAAEQRVGRILLGTGSTSEHELTELLHRCRVMSLKVNLLPTLADMLGTNVELDDVEGVTVLGVNPPWLPRSSRALKRVLDVAIAAPALLIASPLILILAILIKLDSRGGVLFAQERVGRGGKRFEILKLRTMSADAERRRAELLADSKDPNWLLLDRDPRITRIGGTLRKLSLDELPQLWNVLRGDMSLVGPRPLVPAEDERVQGRCRGRLDLTPGITGYWQVLGRTRIPFEEMVNLDYLYVMNWSLWQDVRLILRTLPVVLGGRGAN